MVTHEQIISALARVEEKVAAESLARREFRADFLARLDNIEDGIGDIRERVAKVESATDKRHNPVVTLFDRVITLFERQPLLGVVVAVIVLGLGSGGVVALWEAVTR